jgi:hypothetical protein
VSEDDMLHICADGRAAVVLVGDGPTPEMIHLTDNPPEISFPPIQRAIWVARLRALADMLEQAQP